MEYNVFAVNKQLIIPRKSLLDKDYCCKLNKVFCNERANIPRKSHIGKDYFCKWRDISLQRASKHPKNIASRERIFLQMEHELSAVSKHLPQENHFLTKIIAASWTFFCNEQANIPRKSHSGKIFLQMRGHFSATSKHTSQEHRISRKIISANGT